jgi:hypothetical protein
MFEIVIKESESGLVMETLTASFKEAEAIFKGYEGDSFYAVEARFIR